MKTVKEKELDNLFITGLENSGVMINFHEDDWDALEDMLNKHKKRAGIIYWLPIISGAAALLVLVLGWLLIKSFHDNSRKPVFVKNSGANQNNTMIAKARPAKTTIAKGGAGRQAHTEVQTDHNNTPALVQSTAGKAQGQKPGTSAYAANSNTIKHAPKTKYPSSKAGNLAPLTLNNGSDENGTQFGNQIIAANMPTLNLSGLNNAPLSADIELPKLNKPVTPQAADYKINTKPRTANHPVFAVSVLASPDINGVSSFQNSKVGTNAGLMLSVGIKKFTISTGAVYSKKPYLTDFDSYHTSYKFKTEPEYVSADCRVLDIPINIDYQVYSKSKNKFSLGTGLSSYIMLKESYHFDYASLYPAGPTDYNITNRNKHILGVLNLAATYQRQINSKFSLDIEPYLKVPLTNIGASQVKLQSVGMAVGITWNINSLSKP